MGSALFPPGYMGPVEWSRDAMGEDGKIALTPGVLTVTISQNLLRRTGLRMVAVGWLWLPAACRAGEAGKTSASRQGCTPNPAGDGLSAAPLGRLHAMRRPGSQGP